MKILSFDVGIKNLAYCIIEVDTKENKSHKIVDWDIINCAETLLQGGLKCCVNKKGCICNKPAVNKVTTSTGNELGFCHLKTCQKEMNGTYNKKQIKKYRQKTTKDLSLDEIGSEMYNQLYIKNSLLEVDDIIIENQPVLKNPTMKSIQMLLYSYFLLMKKLSNNPIHYDINLFNARKKLAIYDGPKIDVSKIKNAYSKRKYQSVQYTKYFLEKYNANWSDMFNSNKKQDDLADCYLQGLTYFYNK